MLNNAPFDESVYSLIIDGEIEGTKKFADIDYENCNMAAWDSIKHITRIFWLLYFYGRERLTSDAAYASDMIALFEHWVKHAPKNPNRWYNLIGTPRAVAEIDGKAEFVGTKYFHIPKLLCRHIPGLYIGVKNTDNTTFDMEFGNGEGQLNLNMSYGTHCSIMRTGEEYINLIPTYDAAHIPGTTARLENDEELIAHGQAWSMTKLDSDISGGAQDGDRAVMYELARHDGVETLFACFAYEEGMVFMGTAISDANYDSAHPLTTTLDQSRAAGRVSISADGSVVHNGIRYTRLMGPPLEVRTEKRTGSWFCNNQSRPDEPVTDEIFTIWQTHTGAVGTPYAYVVTPESVVPAVAVVCNDTSEQSVRLGDGTVMAVRYGDDGQAVTVG